MVRKMNNRKVEKHKAEGETRHKLKNQFVVFIEQNKRAFVVNIFSGRLW